MTLQQPLSETISRKPSILGRVLLSASPLFSSSIFTSVSFMNSSLPFGIGDILTYGGPNPIMSNPTDDDP